MRLVFYGIVSVNMNNMRALIKQCFFLIFSINIVERKVRLLAKVILYFKAFLHSQMKVKHKFKPENEKKTEQFVFHDAVFRHKKPNVSTEKKKKGMEERE